MLDFKAALFEKTGESAISAARERNIRNHIVRNIHDMKLFPDIVQCPQPDVLSGCGRLCLGNADGQDDLAVRLLPVAAGADARGADEIELMVDGI